MYCGLLESYCLAWKNDVQRRIRGGLGTEVFGRLEEIHNSERIRRKREEDVVRKLDTKPGRGGGEGL